MSNKITYEVIFTNETSGKSSPVSLPSGQQSDNGVNVPEAERNQAAGSVVASGLVAVNQITPYVTQAVNFQISQLSVTMGSDELQRKLSTASSLVSSASGIAMGAIAGGVPGAMISAGMQAINSIISLSYNRASIQNRKQLESESLNLRNSRVGLVSNRSRNGGVA
jgi:hypothetical protein